MLINYTIDAFASLISLINFIESQNSEGAGLRWFEKYEKFLDKCFSGVLKKRLCNNATFHKLELHCVYFRDWVIAYSINNEFILIEAFLHKSRIRD